MSISAEPIHPPATESVDDGDRCPVDHAALARQKTGRVAEPSRTPIEQDAAGVWQVRGFEAARAILRSADTKQTGFRAELLEQLPTGIKNSPILYQEGKAHQQQRKQTARFFTPKTVSSDYRQLMERLSDRLLDKLRRARRADLSQLSMTLAVRVAAEVVGLTNSRLPGLEKRLDAFFAQDIPAFSLKPLAFARFLYTQLSMVVFFYLDVQPAIRARKRQPREDVISHLIAQRYNSTEILTECITYAAAGMATTREFISVAAWHFLEQPTLRARYLAAPEAERQELLQEILRLEPVVGHLLRRATADIQLVSQGASVTIRKGDLIDIHIYAANADENAVGEQPLALCPGRKLRDERITPAVMSFGDGHHRCPGAFIAIQETDIFLQRLLVLEGLRIECQPSMGWNDLVTGYELRNFVLALES
ncbi:MAG TPA: cytochrome P450 [Ktedonobacterales bacterium]|nr:cytochrome P450 [Ktedonobacterales bacterium]